MVVVKNLGAGTTGRVFRRTHLFQFLIFIFEKVIRKIFVRFIGGAVLQEGFHRQDKDGSMVEMLIIVRIIVHATLSTDRLEHCFLSSKGELLNELAANISEEFDSKNAGSSRFLISV